MTRTNREVYQVFQTIILGIHVSFRGCNIFCNPLDFCPINTLFRTPKKLPPPLPLGSFSARRNFMSATFDRRSDRFFPGFGGSVTLYPQPCNPRPSFLGGMTQYFEGLKPSCFMFLGVQRIEITKVDLCFS